MNCGWSSLMVDSRLPASCSGPQYVGAQSGSSAGMGDRRPHDDAFDDARVRKSGLWTNTKLYNGKHCSEPVRNRLVLYRHRLAESVMNGSGAGRTRITSCWEVGGSVQHDTVGGGLNQRDVISVLSFEGWNCKEKIYNNDWKHQLQLYKSNYQFIFTCSCESIKIIKLNY